MTTLLVLPTDIVLTEILPKLPLKDTFRLKCVSKSYKTLISTLFFIDILFNNILPRLPVKSLLRFKSVAKSFNTIISSAQFIRLQLHHSHSLPDNQLLILSITQNQHRPFLHYMNLNSLESPPLFRLILPQPFIYNDDGIRIFGSCNGLVCIGAHLLWVFQSHEHFMLLNPSTGISFTVPPPVNHPAKRKGLDVPSANIIGFGYDDVNDDYKIVEIIEYVFSGLKIRDTLVYSLKADSWKLVETTSPAKKSFRFTEAAGALIDNHLLHWFFPSYSLRIACFDLRIEQWVQDVPLPPGGERVTRRDDLVHLGVFDGCLCLLIKGLPYTDDAVNVWIMKEYGVKESWVKLLGVCDQDNALHTYPLIYREEDEILIRISSKYGKYLKLMWYKIIDKQSTSAEIHTVHEVDDMSITDAFVCHGTLVNIPRGNQISKEKRYP